MRAWVARGLAAAIVAGALAATAAPADAQQTGFQSVRFTSQKRPVRVDVFTARGAGRKAAVIVLHGAHGIGRGELIYPQAKALAERGINAFVVHYFDGLNASTRRAAETSVEMAFARDRVIEDAITFVSGRPDVDPKRIGLYGLSLGAYHAVGLAGRDRRIAAVVSMVGAFPGHVQRDALGRLPPILILHGDNDRQVPLEKAFDMAMLFDRLGAAYDMKVYARQGHSFTSPAKENSVNVASDFFVKQLSDPHKPAS